MGTQWIRTDLATELRTEHLKEFCKEKDEQINGIDYSEETVDSFYCNTIRVTNREGSEIIGKEIGTYVTVRSGAIWRSPSKDFYCCTELLAKKLKCCPLNSDIIPERFWFADWGIEKLLPIPSDRTVLGILL